MEPTCEKQFKQFDTPPKKKRFVYFANYEKELYILDKELTQ
jgi:hypothetical protein